MGQFTSDDTHGAGGLLVAGNAPAGAVQSDSAPRAFDAAIGGLLYIAGSSDTESRSLALSAEVRRVLELFEKLDRAAEMFKACAESVKRTSVEVLGQKFTKSEFTRWSVVSDEVPHRSDRRKPDFPT